MIMRSRKLVLVVGESGELQEKLRSAGYDVASAEYKRMIERTDELCPDIIIRDMRGATDFTKVGVGELHFQGYDIPVILFAEGISFESQGEFVAFHPFGMVDASREDAHARLVESVQSLLKFPRPTRAGVSMMRQINSFI